MAGSFSDLVTTFNCQHLLMHLFLYWQMKKKRNEFNGIIFWKLLFLPALEQRLLWVRLMLFFVCVFWLAKPILILTD